ncbi:MAG: peptidylprolyl isomerase [Anaerolineae bacterium]
MVGILVVGILAFGFYQETVVEPASPVAIVNGKSIRTDIYQKRVRLRRSFLYQYLDSLRAQRAQLDPNDPSIGFLFEMIDNNISQVQAELNVVPTQVLQEMIDDELVEEGASELGISVSPEELDKEVEEQVARRLGYQSSASATATAETPSTPSPTPAPSPTPSSIEATATVSGTATVTATEPTAVSTPLSTPTIHVMTADEFQTGYQELLGVLKQEAGLTEADYRHSVKMSLLREKMRKTLAEKIPTVDEQVHARHILVESEEEAKTVLERLQQGEDFAEVAAEVSKDEATKENGGDLGWFPRGQMTPVFEEAAFTLQPGELSEPIQTQYGFHIIRLEEGPERRELSEEALRLKQANALVEWLVQRRKEASIEWLWTLEVVPFDPRAQ